jgi:hypothetical protein
MLSHKAHAAFPTRSTCGSFKCHGGVTQQPIYNNWLLPQNFCVQKINNCVVQNGTKAHTCARSHAKRKILTMHNAKSFTKKHIFQAKNTMLAEKKHKAHYGTGD